MDSPQPPDLMTEDQAAEMIGWSKANLRSHRERFELALLAESLDPRQKRAIRSLVQGRTPRGLAAISGLRLVRDRNGPEANARGLEVLRVLQHGRREFEPPIWEIQGRSVRYRRHVVQLWLDDNTEFRDATDLRKSSVSQGEAALMLGLEISTLRTTRYRAARAQRSIDRGNRLPATLAAANAAPPSIKIGREIRYPTEPLEAWVRTHHRPPHPLLKTRDLSRGRLVEPCEVASQMGITAQSLVGYRARAGSALRRIGEGEERPGDRAASRCCPPHVKVGGRIRYQYLDVQDWEIQGRSVR